ncbi:MAG TPA: creatininase family protein [bacterium]|nr:creatininase family protein [bacterium]
MDLRILFLIMFGCFYTGWGEGLPVQYEELTSPELVAAVHLSGGTIVIPLGILEKHGPHLPLGTDLIHVREMVFRAVKQEFSVVFPPYYFGQIYEARHQPGTIAYSPDLVWRLLQETCDELYRNGFRKIILVNGHGGNAHFLSYFCQSQLSVRKNYAVILFKPEEDPVVEAKIKKLRATATDGHAGETETSMMLAHRPDLVHLDRCRDEPGEDRNRLSGLPYADTGIWWYARFPNHYAGDGSEAKEEIGDLILDSGAGQLAELIRILKQDDRILELQDRFYEAAGAPIQMFGVE